MVDCSGVGREGQGREGKQARGGDRIIVGTGSTENSDACAAE